VGKLDAGAVDGADGSAVACKVSPDGVAAWLAVGFRVPRGFEGVACAFWATPQKLHRFGRATILAHPPVLSLQHVAESLRELDGDDRERRVNRSTVQRTTDL
jgi:hypothetical protein